jgi:hydroxymethylpyrimidine/phosphomethylpyrimidine kinase
MVSTSGTRLLEKGAIRVLCATLLPLATLITPNIREAEILTKKRIDTPEDLRVAAKELHRKFGCAVLIKGGHMLGLKDAIDIFYDGTQELLLTAPFIRGVATHGTGCTYSAAIVGYLALGYPLARSIALAKEFITQAIAQSRKAAGFDVLNTSWGVVGQASRLPTPSGEASRLPTA